MGWKDVHSLDRTLAYNVGTKIINDWSENTHYEELYPALDWDHIKKHLPLPIVFVNHPVTGIVHIHCITDEEYIFAAGLDSGRIRTGDIPPSLIPSYLFYGIVYKVKEAHFQKEAWERHIYDSRLILESQGHCNISGLFDKNASVTIRKYLKNIPESKHNCDPLLEFYQYEFNHRLVPWVFTEKVIPARPPWLGTFKDKDDRQYNDKDTNRFRLEVIMDCNPLIIKETDGWPIKIVLNARNAEIPSVLGDGVIFRDARYRNWRPVLPEKYKVSLATFSYERE